MPDHIHLLLSTLSGMGFKSGNILEPSIGIGNFIGNLLDEMKKFKFYGVELDSVSGRIGKLLYLESDIQIKGLEETSFSNNFFDAVIGNVPFGEYKVNDREYNKNNFLIHDYFFAKSIDKVRNVGIIAFITFSGTMDKKDESVRRYIAARAELLRTIRLLNDTFKGVAGTEVTSDIIFLKKRDSIRERDEDWIHLAEDENGLTYNKYFVDHPEQVLGSMEEVSGQFGNALACMPKENTELKELLTKASEEISKDDEGNKVYHNCSAYGEKSDIPKDFKQGDFVKLFGQIRTSIDYNGKEYSNVRILSSKLLKTREQMKGQEEKKESVLGAIKKYQAEDKEKPKEKKEASKEAER